MASEDEALSTVISVDVCDLREEKDSAVDEDAGRSASDTVTLVLQSLAAASAGKVVTDDRISLAVVSALVTVAACSDVVEVASRGRDVVISRTTFEVFRLARVVELRPDILLNSECVGGCNVAVNGTVVVAPVSMLAITAPVVVSVFR